MGVDKALLEVDGIPMAERVALALAAAGCSKVVFVGGDRVALTALGRPWIADRWPGEGPLGGVLTALTEIGTDVLAAACDLAELDASSVRDLLEAAGEAPPVEVVVAVTDRLEPALSWWSAAARPSVADAWAAGTRAVHEAIAALTSRQVAVAAGALHNVNRPADLGIGREPDAGQTDVRG